VGKTAGKGKKGKGTSARVSSLPPVLNTVITANHTFRFRAGALVSGRGITGEMLAGACGGVCTVANSTVSCWASSIRIHKVTVWPGLGGTTLTEVVWYSPVTSVEKDKSQVSSIPTGVVVPERPIVSSPPRGTLAGSWLAVVPLISTAIFGITCPSGSLVDVSLSWTMTNNLAGQDLGVVAGVLKTTYYLPLDGPGSNQLVAVGVPTTA